MNELPVAWQWHETKQRLRKMSRRWLRSYRRMAFEMHHCDRCCEPIMPGDEYHGAVFVVTHPAWAPHRRSVISVWKHHDICPIDPWERDRELQEEAERYRAEETPADVSIVA